MNNVIAARANSATTRRSSYNPVLKKRLLTKDEARRIAANIGKLPELPQRLTVDTRLGGLTNDHRASIV